jgi:hypothetical protein
VNLKSLLIILYLIINIVRLNAQKNEFIGGVLFNLNGIGLLGNSGQFWNSSKDKVGAGHGGISVGIFVKREFTEKIYSSLEIRYSSKGSIYSFTDQNGNQAHESLYLNYIEIPLQVGYKFKPNKRYFYLETGVAYARLIYSKIEADNVLIRTGTPNTEGFKSNDFIWIGSLKFPLIKKWERNFLVGISVSRSIPSIHKDYKIYNFEYGIAFNYLFSL